MSRKAIVGMVLLAAMPAAGQFKASGVPVRAKVEAAPVQSAPTLDSAALGRIAATTQLTGDLQRQERTLLTRVSERLRHKNRAAAMQDWERVIGMIRGRGGASDVDALTNWVLKQAYLEQSKDLKMYADKVRFFNEQREAAYASRAELERLRSTLRGNSAPRATTIRAMTLAPAYRPGARAVSIGEPKPTTMESVVSELAGIVVLCNKADENAAMANLDLQNALQKQQQTLQTMSNVSKIMHDTAMAVIRKIG
jgi:hypothetical protein